jgi:hypothetical protein
MKWAKFNGAVALCKCILTGRTLQPHVVCCPGQGQLQHLSHYLGLLSLYLNLQK